MSVSSNTQEASSPVESRKKRALVHIGTNKTGTTAIQESLARAAKDGKLAGVAFPMLPGYKQKVVPDHNFFRVLYRPLKEMTRMFTYRTTTPEADRDRDVAAFRAGLAEAVAQNDRFVFSGEFMSTFTPDEIESFRQELAELGITEITPVIYVRDPVSRYLSSVQQRLKASSTFVHPAKYHDSALECIRNWHDAFPQLIVRPFDRAQLHDGDVVSDFLQVFSDYFGADLRGSEIELIASNESISAEGMLLLQQYRAKFHAKRDNVFRADSSELVRLLSESKNAIPQTLPRLNLPTRQVITESHAEFFDVLWDEYGIRYDAASEVVEPIGGHGLTTDTPITLTGILENYDPDIIHELTLWLLQRSLTNSVKMRKKSQ